MVEKRPQADQRSQEVLTESPRGGAVLSGWSVETRSGSSVLRSWQEHSKSGSKTTKQKKKKAGSERKVEANESAYLNFYLRSGSIRKTRSKNLRLSRSPRRCNLKGRCCLHIYIRSTFSWPKPWRRLRSKGNSNSLPNGRGNYIKNRRKDSGLSLTR